MTRIHTDPIFITHPEVAKRAFGWNPLSITAGSGKNLEWKCGKGHVWEARVCDVIRYVPDNSDGCPYCNGRKPIVGSTDLRTTHPDVAALANGWDPVTVMAGSGRRREWKCKLDHIWTTTVRSLALLGTKCPYCTNVKLLVGFNDLKTRFPKIAEQSHGWDPRSVIYGSEKIREWECELGHVWRAAVGARTQAGNNCPTCNPGGFNIKKDAHLYLMVNVALGLYMIGISNGIDRRAHRHFLNDWDLIKLSKKMTGKEALNLETSIKRSLRRRGVHMLTKENFEYHVRGEAWSKDELVVNSIQELIDITNESESHAAHHRYLMELVLAADNERMNAILHSGSPR